VFITVRVSADFSSFCHDYHVICGIICIVHITNNYLKYDHLIGFTTIVVVVQVPYATANRLIFGVGDYTGSLLPLQKDGIVMCTTHNALSVGFKYTRVLF